jgi:hypothetical protein
MPVAYMQYPGSIVDIAEAEKMIEYLGQFNRDVKIVVVCDSTTNDRKSYTAPAALDTLQAIQADRKLSTGKYERRYSLTKKQKEICKALGVEESEIDEIIEALA